MKISLTSYNKTLTWEYPYEDLTSTELLEAFKGLMYTATYPEDVIIRGMEEIVENYRALEDEDCGCE